MRMLRSILALTVLLTGCSEFPQVERQRVLYEITVPAVSDRSDYARCAAVQGDALLLRSHCDVGVAGHGLPSGQGNRESGPGST